MSARGKFAAKALTFLALLLYALFLFLPQARRERAILQGDRHLIAGRYQQAFESYLEAETVSPGDWRVQNRLGRVMDQIRSYPKAWQLYLRALEFSPDNLEVMACLSRSYYLAGRPELAKPVLLDILRIDPANFEALLLLGEVEYALGGAVKARLWVSKVLEHNPYHYGAHGRLGHFWQKDDLHKAVESYGDCLRSGANPAWQRVALSQLASLHAALGRPEQARLAEQHLKALDGEPEQQAEVRKEFLDLDF